jgi:hypothetical protein
MQREAVLMKQVGADELDGAPAVAYIRVSSKEQAEKGGEAEGFSIPAQREACKRKAASLKAALIEQFVERGERPRRLTGQNYSGCSPTSLSIPSSTSSSIRSIVWLATEQTT